MASQRTAELADAPLKFGEFNASFPRGAIQGLAFLYRPRLQPATRCGVQERFAEKLTVRGMNQRVRRQNLRQFRQRPT